jgi:rhodanese-related sulfurtransferase
MREKKAELASFVLIGVMVASIFAGAVSGAGVSAGEAEEEVDIIATEEAEEMLNSRNDVVLDVRSQAEYESGRISRAKLDQYQEGINYGFWFEKTLIRWQEFKPTHTSLSQIDLYIEKNGKPGNMRVSITNDAEDQLWETTVPGEKIAKSGWIEIPVDPSISLKPGDSYYINAWSDADSPGPDNRYFWRGQTKSEYDRGISCVEDSWKGYDFAFRTWSSGGSVGCVDFEDPLLGTRFNVGDVFTDSGATITVQSFQWSNSKWTTGGYAVIEKDGLAGGSGQEIWVNNVNLDFDFGSPCSGISLLFGEYGGNLNIEINGDFRNFQDFVDINGLNIGGVNVVVVNGFGDDKGGLKLSGTIKSLVIGGQELCIDNVCPGAPGEMPDLIVNLNVPEKVIAGEDVALEVIVSNIGSATAPGSIESEIAYYVVDLILSSDDIIPLELAVYPVSAGKTREDFVEDMLLEGGRISRTESISPGNSVSYTLDLYIPEKTSPGIYCLGAVVDPAKTVEELSEENNTYCHKINILPSETSIHPPEGVDFWVMPYGVGGTTLNNINADGLTNYTDWMSGYTMVDAPFGNPPGSRLGFRHGYDGRIPTSEIMYYRWLYKDESETEWNEFTEPVNVHYVKDDHGVVTFPVYSLGPKGINGMNLYEFRPHNAPDVCESTEDCETYWPTTDWFADIYSGFLNTYAISNGKHDIKLEIYNETGNQVMPDGIKFEFIVPTGVDGDGTILTREATSGEIDNGGFVFSLHIDNRKCSAIIDAPSIGTTSMADECGFLRYSPGDEVVHIAFHATHPGNFALFNFRIFRGSKEVTSVNGGEVGAHLIGSYDGDGNGNFENETSMGLLLENCLEAAFSENLYVYAKATTGWGHRINTYDAQAVRAFALSPI